MTEDEVDNLWLLAIGALDDGEADEVRHLLASGDPRAVAVFAEAQEALATLPLSLPQQTPDPTLRDRLMKRLGAAAPAPLGLARWRWAAGFAAAVVVTLTGALVSYIQTERALRSHLATSIVRERHLQQQLAEAERRASLVGAKNLAVVSLASQDQKPAFGRVFWDKQAGAWHVFVFDLAPLPAGREYELWFITPDQRKIPAGTFKVDAGGNGSIVAPLPANESIFLMAAVTDEPVGGSPQPTGTIRLAGAVQ